MRDVVFAILPFCVCVCVVSLHHSLFPEVELIQLRDGCRSSALAVLGRCCTTKPWGAAQQQPVAAVIGLAPG